MLLSLSEPFGSPQLMMSDVRVGFFPQVKPSSTKLTFRTERRVPKLGVMLVGWGGNNGTTVTAAVLANRLGLSWMTKTGTKVSEGVPFMFS